MNTNAQQSAVSGLHWMPPVSNRSELQTPPEDCPKAFALDLSKFGLAVFVYHCGEWSADSVEIVEHSVAKLTVALGTQVPLHRADGTIGHAVVTHHQGKAIAKELAPRGQNRFFTHIDDLAFYKKPD